MARTACSEPPQGLDTATDERVLLAWSVSLSQREPLRRAVAGAAVVGAAVLGWALFRGPLVALVSACIVFSSVAEFLLPVRCRLTTRRAVTLAGLGRQEIAWSAVRRIVVRPNGILLSPLPAASRLDAFRGVVLRFDDADPRESALATIRERLPEITPDE